MRRWLVFTGLLLAGCTVQSVPADFGGLKVLESFDIYEVHRIGKNYYHLIENETTNERRKIKITQQEYQNLSKSVFQPEMGWKWIYSIEVDRYDTFNEELNDGQYVIIDNGVSIKIKNSKFPIILHTEIYSPFIVNGKLNLGKNPKSDIFQILNGVLTVYDISRLGKLQIIPTSSLLLPDVK